jgi:hypothetical protein
MSRRVRSSKGLNPEVIVIRREERAEQSERDRQERECPLRLTLEAAFDAYAAKDREEARAWASVKASANLPAAKTAKASRARSEADSLFRRTA